MTEFVPPKHIIAASGLIRNPSGQVLMLESPKRGWELPGGQVEEGESLIQALERETLEETGIVVRVGALVSVCSNVKPPAKVIFGFLATYVSGDCRTSSESLRVEWVDETDVLKRITHPAIYDRACDMLNFDRRVVYRVYTTDPYQVQHETFL
jgi:8-oxo-dGTP diphosphatase